MLSALKPKDSKPIECMFNPTEYTLTQATNVTWTAVPNKPGGTAEYGGTKPLRLGVKLFFDEFDAAKGDITPKITRLLSWTLPMEQTRQDKKPTSPLIAFVWGNSQLANFCGYLTNVDITYKLFSKDGTPLRADVTIGRESGLSPCGRLLAGGGDRVHDPAADVTPPGCPTPPLPLGETSAKGA